MAPKDDTVRGVDPAEPDADDMPAHGPEAAGMRRVRMGAKGKRMAPNAGTRHPEVPAGSQGVLPGPVGRHGPPARQRNR